jgi:hypothetical protein
MTNEQYEAVIEYAKKHACFNQSTRELLESLCDVKIYTIVDLPDDQLIFTYGPSKEIGMSAASFVDLRMRVDGEPKSLTIGIGWPD